MEIFNGNQSVTFTSHFAFKGESYLEERKKYETFNQFFLIIYLM